MKRYKSNYPVRMMCRLLRISVSGFYGWLSREPSGRSRKSEMLLLEIKRIFQEEKGRVGSPRMTRILRNEGFVAGHNRVSRLMRSAHLRAKAAKKYKATTQSNHTLPVAPNLLLQAFSACRPNERWVSDITYIWTDEGWLYLAVILDLYSRMVVGWSMSERMTKKLVQDALEMALWRRHFPKGVIVHSDRGSQYCSHEYQAMLKKYGLICSMSKKGDCFDNAAMESWNHSFKVEAIHGERFATREQAKAHTFEYIDVYYNRKRLHSTIGFMTPVSFEEKKVA